MMMRSRVRIIDDEQFAGFQNEAFVQAPPTSGDALAETRSGKNGGGEKGERMDKLRRMRCLQRRFQYLESANSMKKKWTLTGRVCFLVFFSLVSFICK